jgi:hypothetical protein
MPQLIAFLNRKMIDGISITAEYSPRNIRKQTIRVVFNVPGIPTFDINVNNYNFLKVSGGDLDNENQTVDKVIQHIMAFKNQKQGGRRIKYNKKRVTHKKRTRHIRRKYSRRN